MYNNKQYNTSFNNLCNQTNTNSKFSKQNSYEQENNEKLVKDFKAVNLTSSVFVPPSQHQLDTIKLMPTSTNSDNIKKIPPPVPPKNIITKQNSIYEPGAKPEKLSPQLSNEANKPFETTTTTSPAVEQDKPAAPDHIKRNKKSKNQRMNESEARKILATMVSPGDPLEKYELKDKLGSGAAGEVYRAISKQTFAQVAIKRMLLEKQQRKDMIVTEIQVMKEMNFKSIVNYIECFLYEKELWIVMEYLEGGALTDIVLETVMDEHQMATVSKECLLALDYLHSHNIIHRDVKSDNVLVGMKGEVKLTGKIIILERINKKKIKFRFY